MRLAIARTLSHKLGAARASTGALQCINQPVAVASPGDSLVDLRTGGAQRNNEEGEKEAVVVRKIMNPPTSASSNRPLRGSASAATPSRRSARGRPPAYGRRRVDADGDPRGLRRGPGRPRVRRRGGVRRRRQGPSGFSRGPALLNAEQVLEGAIVGGSSPPRARATVVLDEGAAARLWSLKDLRRLVRRDATVAPALRACYDTAPPRAGRGI